MVEHCEASDREEAEDAAERRTAGGSEKVGHLPGASGLIDLVNGHASARLAFTGCIGNVAATCRRRHRSADGFLNIPDSRTAEASLLTGMGAVRAARRGVRAGQVAVDGIHVSRRAADRAG